MDSDGKSNLIKVEVAYAAPDRQCILIVELEQGSTVETAIRHSRILDEFPEINLEKQKTGVFGKPRQLNEWVSDGDRIEIYRPLVIDPKDARRAKAKKKGSKPIGL